MRCQNCYSSITQLLSLKEIFLFQPISKQVMCVRCFKQLNRIDRTTACQTCLKKASYDHCLDCQKWQMEYPNIELAHESLFEYNSFFAEWLEEFKYKGNFKKAVCFKEELRSYLQNKEYDLLIPIPISESKRKQRGFNQVEALMFYADLAYVSVLEKKKTSFSQAQKNRQDRLLLAQVFRVKENYQEIVVDKKILLVDDVYTTGSTLLHGVDCLAANGAKKIDTFSLAR